MNRIEHLANFVLSKALASVLIIMRWKKKTVLSNLKYIFPEKKDCEKKQLYRELIHKISKTAVEFIQGNNIYKKIPEQLNDYPHKNGNLQFVIDHNSKLVLEKMKNGGLFLTAHYNNYEAIGIWLCKLGIPLKASYAQLKPKFLNEFVEKKLRTVNNKSYSVYVKNPKDILNYIEKGNLFCLVADQDYRKRNFVTGKFLEREVHCNPIPNFILKYFPNTPIYICWISEEKNIKELHAVEIFGTDVYHFYHKLINQLINTRPTSWFCWTHRRFLSVDNKNTIY